MAHASAPSRAVSATGCAIEPKGLGLGALVCVSGQPDRTGRVIELPQAPLARVAWGASTRLHWIDDLMVLVAPRNVRLRDRLRQSFRAE